MSTTPSGTRSRPTNRYARIKRTYLRNGAIKLDSLIFGAYGTPSVDAERRGQIFAYDRNGRRTFMDWLLGQTAYTYTTFGALQQVRDPGLNTYRLVYDPQSSLTDKKLVRKQAMIEPPSEASGTPHRRHSHLHVVVRIDDGPGETADLISLTKAYADLGDANREAARLNELNRNKGCRYLVMVARWEPAQPEGGLSAHNP